MPKVRKPQRLPISDHVTGLVTRLDYSLLLSTSELESHEVLVRGELVLRYGITYLGKPYRSIVPELVIADYGELLSGEDAWSFLMERSHLYPRADVCGIRNDGEEDMLVLKQLDFDYPYDVFVYRRAEDRQPLGKLSALIASDRSHLPQRLLKHLPCYPSLSAWRNRG